MFLKKKIAKSRIKATKTFALIMPRFEDVDRSFYAEEILKGIGLTASRLKVDVLFHVTERYDHQDWVDTRLLDPHAIDGIIFADIDNDAETLQKVIATGIPYVVLNNMFEEPINSVAVDNFKAAFDVIEYLIKLGHERIAIISGDQRTQAGRLRLDGYQEALTTHKIDVRKEYIKYGDFLRTPSRRAAQELLSLSQRPTAVFACSDVMALEVISEAKTRAVNVPGELSVVGFDDNPVNMHSPVRLATVSQPLKEMGRLGLEKLNLICEGKIGVPVQILLSTRLIERESAAKTGA